MQHGVADPQQSPIDTQSIWEQFHDRLLAYVRRRVTHAADAEDIVQEVFSRIHTSLHRLREAQSATAWVYRITSNAITDFYRSNAKAAGALDQLQRETASANDLPLAPSEIHEEDSGPSAELSHCLVPLLTELPDRYREAIRLTDLGGLSQKQAAQELGLSVSGMKSRVQRGRSKLKDILLECCSVELDRRRSVIDVQSREEGGCSDCD